MNNNFLKAPIYFLAFFFIAISASMNISFYHSLAANSLFNKVIFISLGLGLDAAKITLLIYCYYLLFHEKYIRAFTGLFIWISLCSISFFTAMGNFSNNSETYQQDKQKIQDSFQTVKSQYDRNQEKLESLTLYSDIVQLKELEASREKYELALNDMYNSRAFNTQNNDVGTVLSRVGDCNNIKANYYTRKYCPELIAYSSTIKTIDDKLDKYIEYRSLDKKRDELEKKLSSMERNVDGKTTHSLFNTVEALTGIEANRLSQIFLTFSSLIFELLGSFLSVISLNFKPNNTKDDYVYPVPIKTPSKDDTSKTNDINLKYSQLVSDIKQKKVSNVSYAELKKYFGINDSETIKQIRTRLLDDKIGVLDSTNKIILV